MHIAYATTADMQQNGIGAAVKISTKGLYAVRLMICLAEHQQNQIVSLKEISDSTQISKKYLEQIVPNLTASNLVKSVRGASGGYRLAKDPRFISIFDVLNVTEGNLSPVSCLSANGEIDCTFDSQCKEIFVWEHLRDIVEDYLKSVSLQDVLDKSEALAGDNYCI